MPKPKHDTHPSHTHIYVHPHQKYDHRPNSEAPYDPSVLRIDGAERPNWRFKFAALDNGHVACVSRGPPSDAIEDYRQVRCWFGCAFGVTVCIGSYGGVL